jgi:hypothetical protein
MPLYSFDPVEAEIFARRRRTGPPLDEALARLRRPRSLRRPAEPLRPQRTTTRRAA